MEQKKNPKADLEKRKGLFLEIGLVVILAACLCAFSIKSYDKDESFGGNQGPEEPELNMDQIEVVDDKVEIKQDIVIKEFDEVQNTQIAEVKIEDEVDEDEVKIFTVVENDPEFPGGMDALYKYLAENIKYPQLARDNGITGKVYVTFVVERDGSIANPKILRDIGGGCGAEALRVVKSMPKWTPGKQRGKAVRVQFNLPVNFNLK